MVEKVYKYINENNMLDGCRHIVVGVSGGADSVCLIIVLCNIIKKYGLDVKLTAVHINHGIRGAEADRDEAFTKNLCGGLGVPLVAKAVDVPRLAREDGLSEEEAGRKARYEIFGRLAGHDGRIAVAHHMDDEAETVLMNIFRGCGLKGAGGIAPVRENIIRPFLCISRSEIEDYLKSIGQSYMTDSTNLSCDYTRNRLRNDIIPIIRGSFNPNVTERLCHMAEEMRAAEDYMEQQAEALKAEVCSFDIGAMGKRCVVSLERFKNVPEVLQSRIISGALAQLAGSCKDIYRKHIEAVLELANMQAGKEIYLPYGITAVRSCEAVELLQGYDINRRVNNESEIKKDVSAGSVDSGCIDSGRHIDKCCLYMEMQPEKLLEKPIVLEIPGSVYYDGKLKTGARMFFEVYENSEFYKSIEKNRNNDYTKYFDYDTIKNTICVRNRREGDCITISCRKVDGSEVYGNKKLKKEFTDKKIPGIFKDMVVLLAVGNNILWAAGVRQSMRYYVKDTTKRILKVSIDFKEDEGYDTRNQRIDI